jgi:hypothetical protein
LSTSIFQRRMREQHVQAVEYLVWYLKVGTRPVITAVIVNSGRELKSLDEWRLNSQMTDRRTEIGHLLPLSRVLLTSHTRVLGAREPAFQS